MITLMNSLLHFKYVTFDSIIQVSRYTKMDIGGKVIFITGGAGEIGLATVRQLLKNGAKGVALVDISEELGEKAVKELESSFGQDRVLFVRTDITDEKELQAAYKKTVEVFSQMDIVINNAAIVDESKWEKILDVNLVALINSCYLAMETYLPKYRSTQEGLIINISSLLALDPSQDVPIYSASKAAVLNLGRSLGGDEFYKNYQVRVVTLCPGLVKTELFFGSKIKTVFPHIREAEGKKFRIKAQPVESVADAVVDVIKIGMNGSIWAVENGEKVYEIEIPDRAQMHK